MEPLAESYHRIRNASVELAAPLAVEDQVVQTIPEVSPTKWHLAHVTWFFERFCLLGHKPSYEIFDERYHRLFNSYYYTVGEMHSRAHRGLLSRPTVFEIGAFRQQVDTAMLDLIAEREGDTEFSFLVELGLNHEQQHQELLLTDIKHVFFANPLGPIYTAWIEHTTAQPETLRFVDRPGGIYEIGHDAASFCFDNETPRHRALIEEHALGHRLVTNAEYREFIDDAGYRTPVLWLSDGWAKICQDDWNRPLCWSEDLAREFTLSGWIDLDPNVPVTHVSFYEADAFARWAGVRLPNEAEWELAAAETPLDGNLLEQRLFRPVAPSISGNKPKIQQLWGDVWEWTSSSYNPYLGFKPLAGSLGEYNGKFMCNQMVVRGGSCVTWRDHLRPTYRSFFYPHDRWQFLGFRLAK